MKWIVLGLLATLFGKNFNVGHYVQTPQIFSGPNISTNFFQPSDNMSTAMLQRLMQRHLLLIGRPPPQTREHKWAQKRVAVEASPIININIISISKGTGTSTGQPKEVVTSRPAGTNIVPTLDQTSASPTTRFTLETNNAPVSSTTSIATFLLTRDRCSVVEVLVVAEGMVEVSNGAQE